VLSSSTIKANVEVRWLAWLAWIAAGCGDNHLGVSDAAPDTNTPVCDPAGCPSDTCHVAACIENVCALVDVSLPQPGGSVQAGIAHALTRYRILLFEIAEICARVFVD
jgi:hypothetical protein